MTLQLDAVCMQVVRCYHARLVDLHPIFVHIVADVRAAGPQSMILERLIGTFQKIGSSTRVSLKEQQMDDILQIKFNSPAVAEFDLRPLVHQWLMKTKRKPQTFFDIAKVKMHERYRNFFIEAKTRQRRVITAGDDMLEDLVLSDDE